jgi:tetratricopeptide (TPR) repeat protein
MKLLLKPLRFGLTRLLTFVLAFSQLSSTKAAEVKRAIEYSKEPTVLTMERPLERVCINVKVNGHDAKFLVAPEIHSSILLEPSARQFGLKPQADPQNPKRFKDLVIAEIALGQTHLRNEIVGISQMDNPFGMADAFPGVDGVLGYASLQPFAVSWDFKLNEMMITKSGGLPALPKDAIKVAIEQDSRTFGGSKHGSMTVQGRTEDGREIPICPSLLIQGCASVGFLKKIYPQQNPTVGASFATGSLTIKDRGMGQWKLLVTQDMREDEVMMGGSVMRIPFVSTFNYLKIDFPGDWMAFEMGARSCAFEPWGFAVQAREKDGKWLVLPLEPNRPAARGKLQAQDELVSINGIAITPGAPIPQSLQQLGTSKPQSMTIKILRGKSEPMEITLTSTWDDLFPGGPVARGQERTISGLDGIIEVPLDTDSGHLIVPVTINGQSLRLVLTTGAPTTLLQSDVADKLGMKLIPALHFRIMNEMKLGKLVIKQEPIQCKEVSLLSWLKADGLLGLASLADGNFQIDPQAKMLRLWPAGHTGPKSNPNGTRLQLTFHDLPIPPSDAPQRFRPMYISTPVLISGQSFDCLVDTGSHHSGDCFLELKPDAVKTKLPELLTKAGPPAFAGQNFGGRSAARPVNVLDVGFGNELLAHLDAVILDEADFFADHTVCDGLVCLDLLKHFRLTFDFTEKVMIAESLGTLQKELQGEGTEGGGFGLTMDLVRGKLLARALEPHGAADQFGLNAGDIFLAINGTPMAELSPGQFKEIGSSKPGTVVNVKVDREGEELEFCLISPSKAGRLAEVPATKPEHAPALLGRAKVKIKRKEPAGAMKDLDQAIALDSKLGGAYAERGRLLSDKNDYEAAVKDFTVALKTEPKAFTYVLRAYAYECLKKPKEALADYLAATKAEDRYADPFCSAGQIMATEGDADGALGMFNEALKLDDASVSAYLERGKIYTGRKDYPAAVKDLTKAAELAPEADTFANLGYAQYLAENYEASVDAYTEAIKLEPTSSNYVNRASVRSAAKDYEGSHQDYAKAIELDPKNAGAHVSEAATYEQQKAIPHAIESYTKAIAIEDTAGTRLSRGYHYETSQQPQEALVDYTAATRLEPENAEAWRYLGNHKSVQGDHAGALEIFGQALKFTNSPADILSARARAYGRKEDFKSALKDNAEALKLKPKDQPMFLQRTWLLGKSDEYSTAVTELKARIKQEPENLVLLHQLAYLYDIQYDQAHGIEVYRTILKLDSKNVAAYRGLASALLLKQDPLASLAAANEALRLDPKSEQAMAHRSRAKAELGEYSDALKDIETAVQQNPKSTYCVFIRGWLRCHERNWKGAVEDYKLATALAKSPKYYAYNLWYCYTKLGDAAAASKALKEGGEEWKAHPPTSFVNRWNSGLISFLAGEKEETALVALLKDQSKESKESCLRYIDLFLGVKELAAGKPAEARKRFEAAASGNLVDMTRSLAKWELEAMKSK